MQKAPALVLDVKGGVARPVTLVTTSDWSPHLTKHRGNGISEPYHQTCGTSKVW